MSDRNSPFAAELDDVISKPKRALIDQPRDEALTLAQAPPAARKEPWSTYVPFPAGTELDVKGGLSIPFIDNLTADGTGKIEERTPDKLVFSFAVKMIGETAKARVTVVYKEDGSNNTTDFASSTTGQAVKNAPTHITSLPHERVVTLIGDLAIKTNAPFPLPDPITLKVVHVRPAQDRIELEAEFAGLPNGFLRAAKKAPEAKK